MAHFSMRCGWEHFFHFFMSTRLTISFSSLRTPYISWVIQLKSYYCILFMHPNTSAKCVRPTNDQGGGSNWWTPTLGSVAFVMWMLETTVGLWLTRECVTTQATVFFLGNKLSWQWARCARAQQEECSGREAQCAVAYLPASGLWRSGLCLLGRSSFSNPFWCPEKGSFLVPWIVDRPKLSHGLLTQSDCGVIDS